MFGIGCRFRFYWKDVLIFNGWWIKRVQSNVLIFWHISEKTQWFYMEQIKFKKSIKNLSMAFKESYDKNFFSIYWTVINCKIYQS